METQRILALDLGTRRIGMAVSDGLGITAQGLPTLLRRNLRVDLDQLASVVEQYAVKKILIGDPKRMSGEAGSRSEWAHALAERIGSRLQLEIEFWDERLTSREAERTLRGSGVAAENRKAAIDRLSAVILLQSYLDSMSYRQAESIG